MAVHGKSKYWSDFSCHIFEMINKQWFLPAVSHMPFSILPWRTPDIWQNQPCHCHCSSSSNKNLVWPQPQLGSKESTGSKMWSEGLFSLLVVETKLRKALPQLLLAQLLWEHVRFHSCMTFNPSSQLQLITTVYLPRNSCFTETLLATLWLHRVSQHFVCSSFWDLWMTLYIKIIWNIAAFAKGNKHYKTQWP